MRGFDVASALRAGIGLVACVAVTLAARSPVPVFNPASRSTFAALPDTAVSERSGPFRLGDAAAPFGYSTVVGDFNTDGQPDVAVADHVGGRGAIEPYEYRLQFSVSGQPVRAVTFEATQKAIDLRLADVDRDNDLDLIVGEPLSGETVAVWLNDGHGHFTQGSVADVPAAMAAVASLTSSDSFGVAEVAESPTRVFETGVLASATAVPSLDRRRLAAISTCLPRSALTPCGTNPRAPPAPSSRPLIS